MTEASRVCPKCSQLKQAAAFLTSSKTGKLLTPCRQCRAEYAKAKRAEFRKVVPRKNRIRSEIVTADGKAICKRCGEAHPLDQYQGNRPGGWCRKCRTENERNRNRSAGRKERKASKIESENKLCMHCLKMKPLSQFSPTQRGLGGVSAYCRPCAKVRYYDKEYQRQCTAIYRKVNRERWLALHRVHQFERRHKIKVTQDGSVTDEFLKRLYSTQTCFYCGEITPKAKRTADHRVALANGGTHTADNLVMACLVCNSSKRDLTEETFRETLNDRSQNY